MTEIPIVTEIEREPLRFFVCSRTDPNQRYLVDLEEHDFNGLCGCPGFSYRMSPLINKPGWKPGAETQCWHIRMARYYLTEKCLRVIAGAANEK